MEQDGTGIRTVKGLLNRRKHNMLLMRQGKRGRRVVQETRWQGQILRLVNNLQGLSGQEPLNRGGGPGKMASQLHRGHHRPFRHEGENLLPPGAYPWHWPRRHPIAGYLCPKGLLKFRVAPLDPSPVSPLQQFVPFLLLAQKGCQRQNCLIFRF